MNKCFRYLALAIAIVLCAAQMLTGAIAETENSNEPLVLYILPENATELGIPVETQYTTFYFPIENTEGLKLTLTEAEGWTIIMVAAAIGEVEEDLYYLTLGQIESDGNFVGALQHEIFGRVEIHMQMAETDMDVFAEEDHDWVYTLQESMNLILDQLMEDPRYIAE